MGMLPVGGMPHMGMGAPMGGHHGGPPQAQGQHIMECTKQYVGRIIGRAGETINLLQQKSGAKVQIDQKVPDGMPCKINISGSNDCVSLAIQLVNEVIANGPNRLQMYPNAMPQYGMPPAMPVHSPYGQQQGGYYGGMPGGYGAPAGGMYGGGMPPAAMYGGGGGGGAAMGGGYYGGAPNAAPQGAYGGAGGYYGGGAAGGPQVAVAASSAAGGWGHQQGGYHPAAAPHSKPPGGSSQWSEHKTDEGVSYWYNASTGVSQWDRPK